MPLLVLVYVLGQLDRVNVSFAALTMNRDLGFSAAVYGFGASLFFLGYLIFQLPANILLARFGARRIITTIMVVWGVVSAATALVTSASEFYAVRLLLGVAESGLYPGIMLYITYWFSRQHRAMAVSLFTLSIPIAGVLGSPLSGWIMEHFDQTAGLAGWQWLFVMEGLPCSLLALIVWWVLTDRPAQAHWLSDQQRRLLVSQLDQASVEHSGPGKFHQEQSNPEKSSQDSPQSPPKPVAGIGGALANQQIWWLVGINFLYSGALVGTLYWLPRAVADAGPELGQSAIGWHVGLPYLAFAVSTLLWGWHGSRHNERFWHPLSGMAITAVALFWLAGDLTLLSTDLAITLFMLGIGAGFSGLWGLVTTVLPVHLAVVGIAVVNIAGSLGSFAGIALSGQAINASGQTGSGFLLLGFAIAGAIVLMLVGRSGLGGDPAPTRVPIQESTA